MQSWVTKGGWMEQCAKLTKNEWGLQIQELSCTYYIAKEKLCKWTKLSINVIYFLFTCLRIGIRTTTKCELNMIIYKVNQNWLKVIKSTYHTRAPNSKMMASRVKSLLCTYIKTGRKLILNHLNYVWFIWIWKDLSCIWNFMTLT